MEGEKQTAPPRLLVSEPGSLSLEFTRLSQLTRDPKYYDAVQRVSDVMEQGQNTTKLPGMWPVTIDLKTPSFADDNLFTLGGMSDSLYEYFPKQFMIMGGLLDQPKNMYETFIKVAKERLFFRIYNQKDENLTVSGDVRILSNVPSLVPKGQHLTCFTGGMVGIASKIFNRPEDLSLAEELAGGCVWAYDSSINGIAPEIFSVMPCPKNHPCTWSDKIWHDKLNDQYHSPVGTDTGNTENALRIIKERRLSPGMTAIDDHRYILRPEAIESVFMMWRITGDRKWQEAAWRMFERVEKVSRTDIAASAIADITFPFSEVIKTQKMDSMESFWLAETLKYFYLCFESFDTVSLDNFVLNTEAHPLRRPGR
jgi:mannosyl-oligosaccharide alpha-1,2-mannosidase